MTIRNWLCVLSAFLFLGGKALAEPFSFATNEVEIAVARSVNHAPVRVAVSAAPGFDYSLLQVDSDSPWVSASVDVPGRAVVLTFATSSLTQTN